MNDEQKGSHIKAAGGATSAVAPVHAGDLPTPHQAENKNGESADNTALPSSSGQSPEAGKPAVSAKKLQANRENAQKSTGPRTQSGKEKSAANSYKHGFFANRIFRNMEQWAKDHVEYETVATGFHQHYHPVGYVENFMVEKIATEALRLARLLEYEQKMLGWSHPFEGRSSNSLQRYQAAINRQLFQAMEELERHQAIRKAAQTLTARPSPTAVGTAEEYEDPASAPDGQTDARPTASVATATEPTGDESEPSGPETAPGEIFLTDPPPAEAAERAVSATQAPVPLSVALPPQTQSEGTKPRKSLADIATEIISSN